MINPQNIPDTIHNNIHNNIHKAIGGSWPLTNAATTTGHEEISMASWVTRSPIAYVWLLLSSTK